MKTIQIAAVLVAQRLLAGGQIDDAQPPVGEGRLVVEVKAALVRAPVAEHRAHPTRAIRVTRCQPTRPDDACNPAHDAVLR